MFRTRYRTVISLIAISVVIASATFVIHRVNQNIRNSYAVWWAADMVIAHLHDNDGQWPSDWNELRDDYDYLVEHSGRPWSFDELQQRVTIEWNASTNDMAERLRAGDTNLNVISSSDGSNSHWIDEEPNGKIAEYLKRHHVAPEEAE